jgi:hypothetical protein
VRELLSLEFFNGERFVSLKQIVSRLINFCSFWRRTTPLQLFRAGGRVAALPETECAHEGQRGSHVRAFATRPMAQQAKAPTRSTDRHLAGFTIVQRNDVEIAVTLLHKCCAADHSFLEGQV